MRRKLNMTTRDLIYEIKHETGLSSYESALVLESMILNEESPISSLYSSMGDAMWDTVKTMLAERIIEALGYGHKKGTFVHTAVINWVESIEFTQIQAYFNDWDDGGCEMWINSLLDTLVETLAELVINRIIETVKEQIDAGDTPKGDKSGSESFGIDTVAVNAAFEKFTGGITIDNIKSLVGNLAREKIFNVIFTEEKRNEVTAAICDAMSDFSLSNFASSGISGITSSIGSMFGMGNDEGEAV